MSDVTACKAPPPLLQLIDLPPLKAAIHNPVPWLKLPSLTPQSHTSKAGCMLAEVKAGEGGGGGRWRYWRLLGRCSHGRETRGAGRAPAVEGGRPEGALEQLVGEWVLILWSRGKWEALCLNLVARTCPGYQTGLALMGGWRMKSVFCK